MNKMVYFLSICTVMATGRGTLKLIINPFYENLSCISPIEQNPFFNFSFLQRHLKATRKENETESDVGTNGSLLGILPKESSYSCIEMNGKEVFRFAVKVVPQSIELALEKAGLAASSIDWLLLHQVR